jgi:predicted O-linked N-acetylglucosamine transferase (SPINDLY family)
MLAFNSVKMLFKTKALINNEIRTEFINKFHAKVQDRIIIIDCKLSHLEHLETYNQMDIAIDTMVYSGTTTTCEALSMGVPVLSWYDCTYYFHASNVSASILKNSNMDFYVSKNTEEMISKIKILLDKPIDFWKTIKTQTRNDFLNGYVCNKKEYMKNIQELFIKLFYNQNYN